MREVPQLTRNEPRGGTVAFVIVAGLWIVVVGIYLTHSIVLSSDSINNHVHVWYIAHDLWHHGRLPWKMPVLGHGEAYAYPYGLTNWTTAALFWPLFGDWTVTLWTVLGVVGCIVATFVAFPELRHGYWAAAVLANSAILQALLFGQQSFAWGAALVLFGIACWRRGHRGWAAVLVGVGQYTHPAVVAPMALVMVILYLLFTHDRWAVIRWYALSCLITIPAVIIVFASPTFSDTSSGSRMLNFWITLGPRVLIVVLPMFYAVLYHAGRRALGPMALGLSIVASVSLYFPMNVAHQVHALFRWHADTSEIDAYTHSPQFTKGTTTYRVLRDGDGKLGMYRVLRAGGSLDSELFPESMGMHSFTSIADYKQFLCDRHVNQVIHFTSYDNQRHTNEHALLDQLVAQGRATVLASGPDWQAYKINGSACADA